MFASAIYLAHGRQNSSETLQKLLRLISTLKVILLLKTEVVLGQHGSTGGRGSDEI